LCRFLVVSLLIPFGILCFSFPILLVFASDFGPGLWADTKGSLVAGKDTAARLYRVSCFGNQTGRIPTLRLVASNPDRHAVSWGIREQFTRYVYVLGYSILVVVGFGVACFFASYYACRGP
jgi:hypothetical protein